MRDTYLYAQILKYYVYAILEQSHIMFEKLIYYTSVCNNSESREVLKTEMKKYLDNVKVEKKILRYIKKEFDYINLNDIERFLDIIDDNYEYRYKRLESILALFDENIYSRINLSFKEINTLDEYNKYLNFIHGFNKENVKEFIIGEKILDEDNYNKIVKDSKILNIGTENRDSFGIFNNNLILPTIKDDVSSLIYIYEITRMSLLLNEEDIKNPDIPLFYQLLFKQKNGHIKCDIESSDNANKLLKDYFNEPFKEQIKRLKKY